MVNGPPTPPPTTEAELRDAAAPGNTAAATGTSTTSTPSTGSSTTLTATADVYQRAFPTLLDLATKTNYMALIESAETIDLSAVRENEHRLTRFYITAPLVLAYLIIDDIPPARHALLRLPDQLQLSPLGQALTNLVVSTIERRYNDVYSRSEALFQLAGDANFPDSTLGKTITGLTLHFVDSFRSKTSALLKGAYTSLPVSLAQMYLGLSPEQLVEATKTLGWNVDASTGILTLPTPRIDSNPSLLKANVSSLAMFHFVADSVARQEL